MMKNKEQMMTILLMLFFSMSHMSCNKDVEGTLDYSVHYCLLDENGDESTSFHMGEDIVFELTLVNTSDHELKFKDEREFILSAFSVYNSSRDYMNTAAVNVLENMHPVSVKPGESYQKRQRWEREPLPPGEYYSPLTVRIGNKTRNYITKFKVH